MDDGFNAVVIIKGMECPFDPVRSVALIYCEKCSHQNEVECEVQDGKGVILGFVCEKCGAWNAPGD